MPPTDIPNAPPLRPDFLAKSSGQRADHPDRVRTSVSGINGLTLRAEPTWNDGSSETTPGADGSIGVVSGGRGHASGRGGSDGCALRTARGRGDHAGPRFDLTVPPDGYAWWYIDGISDDGERAISVIAFIGSVFSPWYRWSGRRDPHNNVCINVATYGRGGRFTMTDRGRAALRQSPERFTVGPSSLHWTGDRLEISVDERGGPPFFGRIRGKITVTPSAISDQELPLTPDGAHIWRPFAPVSDISVDLDAKGWRWKGHGYFDANFGTRALEADFDDWTWGRYPTTQGATCFYDARHRDGGTLSASIDFSPDGDARMVDAPPTARLPRSLWAVARTTRADSGHTPHQVKAMLDAPFYTRAMVETKIRGERSTGVHEALDLTRFRSPLLMPMLACRVPRRAGWRFTD